MTELMRTPTIEAGAIVPDACPAGPVGTITVGYVAATRNAIHPGMHAAEKFCSDLSPDTPKANAWLPADRREGRDYWAAVQDRLWNEHDFVFKRGDLFYHSKGAPPAWDGFAEDATGLTLIPLNMAEPVLVVRGCDAAHRLGFSPHGAGRNFSRSELKRRVAGKTSGQLLRDETEGPDIRIHAGGVDASELLYSYKNADGVVAQIKAYGLANIEN